MDKRRLFMLPALLCLTPIFTASAHAGYKAKVVDALTGEPIEGVVMLMYWYRSCLHQFSTEQFFDAEETLTDKQGMFEIQGHKVNWNPLCRIGTPHFFIYKAGYKDIDLAWFMPAFKEDRMKKYLIFEGDLIIFKLQKAMTREERSRALSTRGTFPDRYQRLLIRETNKERESLNLPLIKEVDDASK